MDEFLVDPAGAGWDERADLEWMLVGIVALIGDDQLRLLIRIAEDLYARSVPGTGG